MRGRPTFASLLWPAMPAAAGAVLICVVILAAGADPREAAIALARGSLQGSYSIAETLIRTCPLLLAGLGVAVAFRAGVWNIGAEGQLYMGALAVVWLADGLGALPYPVGIALALGAAAAAGAAWASIAAVLRAYRGVQEVISTIMLNFIAVQVVAWAVHGPLRESTRQFPYSDHLPDSLMLSRLLSPTRLHSGVIIALAATALVWLFLFRTVAGFKIRAAGSAPAAALHAGISPRKVVLQAMAASGALAGIAGAVELMGITGILFEEFSPGYGYTAIAVALVGRLNPLFVLPSALLFGGLQAGASAMQRDAGVNSVLVYLIQGIILLVVAAGSVGRLRQKAALQRIAEEEV